MNNRDIWKSRDRECPPCPHCGTALYEQFWGNGGWAKYEKAGDGETPHSDRRCIEALKAQLARYKLLYG